MFWDYIIKVSHLTRSYQITKKKNLFFALISNIAKVNHTIMVYRIVILVIFV